MGFGTFDPPTVTLIDATGSGAPDPADYAARILAFAKSTRLEMTPELLESLRYTEDDIAYVARTVPSSWEFIHYTFLISGVTRAFTHQLVRTRNASYAQQAMRILNVSIGAGWKASYGPTVTTQTDRAICEEAFEAIDTAYRRLIGSGVAVEDARGVLPTNIRTNILMSCNMRTLVELTAKRSGERVQPEYREVIKQMRESVMKLHPWASEFLDRDSMRVCAELEALIGGLKGDKANKAQKLVDELRKAI